MYIFQTPHLQSKGWQFGGAYAPESSSRSWRLLIDFFRNHWELYKYRHFCDSYAAQALYSSMYQNVEDGPKLFLDVCGQRWIDKYVAQFEAADKERKAAYERHRAEEAAARAKAAAAKAAEEAAAASSSADAAASPRA